MKFAGFWERQFALLADAIILAAPVMLVSSLFLIPAIYGPDVFKLYEAQTVEFFVMFYKKAIYFELGLFAIVAAIMALFTASKWQATPGKKLLRLKVIKSSGDRVGFATAFLRYFSLPLAMLTLQAPERYFIYQKMGSINSAVDLQEFAALLTTPISGYTSMLTFVISTYWIVRVAFSRENTALHDLMFDTRVIKSQ